MCQAFPSIWVSDIFRVELAVGFRECTLPETNSSPLKIDGWNTLFRMSYFKVPNWLLVLGSVILPKKCLDSTSLSIQDFFFASPFGSSDKCD